MAWNVNDAWYSTLKSVYNFGHLVEIACADGQSRKTLEIVGETTKIDMRKPVLTWANRKLNYRFMAGEAAWILSGSDKLEDIAPFNKHIAQFSDDGVRFEGAYGPKIVSQMDYVVDALIKEPTSRRAVLTIWRENPPPSRDTPCTVSVQFLIRNNLLHLVVYMRSSDVWLGLPYDLFTFSMVAGTVFLKLRDKGLKLLDLGTLTNIAGSRHLYQQDVDKIREKNFLEEPGTINTVTDHSHFFVPFFYSADDLLEHLWAVAKGDESGIKQSFISDIVRK